MTQSHNPPSECPRLGGAGPTHKALRTVHRTAVSGMWVNGTCPCDPSIPMGSKSIPPFIPLDSLFSVTYDEATGNILTKSDLGADAQFTYQSSTGSHALCGVSDVSTDWGNVEQSIAYTDFGKVKSIEEGNNSCHIGYLPDGSRGYTTFGDGRTTETRFYGDSFELFRDSLGNSDYIHYLCHGVILYRHGTTMEVLQGYYDAQGSLIALVDADGNVVRRYAYDPWGRRVSPTNWMQEDTTDPDATFHIARGYTMHEHLDDFGLINMNGRVFDPSVAQFLSPDNYIQSDGNWLNYNRYAYCYNNPLSYTDPSGEVIFTMVSALFCPMLMPIAIGIDIGWMSGGFKSVYNGGVFWKGAWKGAISGMVGGLFSFVGGGTLFANTFFGICEGAATGALDAALWKESIGMGMLRGAISGAAFGLFTSGIEASDNFLNGYGFRTNESVIRHYLNNGAYQDAIDFTQYRYGMSEYPNGKKVSMMYDETLEKAGRTDMTNGVVWIGPAAIDSPSELKATMVHEYAHYCLDRYVDDCGIGHIKPYTSKPIPEDLLRDGPNGYANEIFNAGRLKINLAIDGNVQMEALWKDWDHGCVYRYTYPLRYQNSVKLHCY